LSWFSKKETKIPGILYAQDARVIAGGDPNLASAEALEELFSAIKAAAHDGKDFIFTEFDLDSNEQALLRKLGYSVSRRCEEFLVSWTEEF